MANVKISDLTPAAGVADANEFEINEAGTSKKVTGTQISSYVRGDIVTADISDVSVTATELSYVEGVTSAIQTQLDAKIDETSATGSAVLPSGTTAQRDGSPAAGYIRFNSTDNTFEGYDGSEWWPFAGEGAGPLAGFRNAIINGNFDHWQRGTSFTANAYGADRWINLVIGTAATQSRQAFTLGQTDVPNEPEYFCRTVVSSVAGAGNLALLGQRIEGVRSFAGQTVTLSFWAKADAAKNIAVEFGQIFGFGGSPSTAVTGIGVTTLALTTAWQKFTVTVAVPSISGKTLGTSNADYLYMFLWFDAGSDWDARTNSLGQQSGTFDIAQVQLEAGSVATPFERRPVGTELALCQRYYQVGAHNWSLYGLAGWGYTVPLSFRTDMRAIPSISQTVSGLVNMASTGIAALGSSGAALEGQLSAAGNSFYASSWKADAEL